MENIFKKDQKPAADFGFLIFILLIVCFTFLPNNYFLSLDDYFFLPERAYFSNNYDWLRHLLTFSQSRFTWVGDNMLFRPGLFFVNWLFDIYARHDRALLHAISLGNYAFAGIMLYLICSRYVKRIVALTLCGIFIVPRYTDTLANWPHINPYLFSMIFLMASALVFSKIPHSQNVKYQILLSTTLLFLSSLFHEFIVLTIFISIALLLFTYRGKIKSGVKNNLTSKFYFFAPFILSCSLFLILLLINRINFLPPCFYSRGENMSSVTLKAFLFHYAAFIYKTVNFVLPNAVIKMSDIYNVIVWFPILILFVVVAFQTKSFSNFLVRNGKIDVIAVVSVSAVLALSLGIIFGRFITQGGTMAWYIAMIGYFLLVIIAILWSRVSDKIPKAASRVSQGIFVVLAIVTIAQRSVIYHNNHKETNKDIQQEIKVSRGIIDFIERNPSYCYAGIFPDPTRGKDIFDKPDITNVFRSINLVLYYYSSAVRAGIPVYAEINDNSNILSANASIDLCQMNYAENKQDKRWVLLNFSPQKNINGVDTRKQPRGVNMYEAKNKLALSGKSGKLKSLYLTKQKYCFQELHIRLKCDDDFPVMYNTGVVYRSDTNATTVALVDNEAIIYAGLGDNTHIITQGTIPRLSRLFSIVLRRNGPDCLVFMDEYLIAVIPQCDTNPGRIGIVTWENGTSSEIAVDARILPFEDADKDKLSLKPIKRIYL